jgi:hypothetical protein
MLLKKYLHNYGEIIFLSEEKKPDFINDVKHIKTGKGEWGERLIRGLNKIEEDYIFYMQEDFWAQKKLVLKDEFLTMFYDYNMTQLNIKNHTTDMGIIYEKINKNLYKMAQNSNYTHNHQFALWKKNSLINNILPNENPWKNEINGTIRLNKTPHNVYLFDFYWYVSTCTKGKLNNRGQNIIKKEKIIF